MHAFDRKTGFYSSLETLSQPQRQDYLLRRLQETLGFAYQFAPAIKKKLDEAGVKPADIRTLDDLKYIPVTKKSELIKLQQQNPPFGGFCTQPLHALKRIYASPGPLFEPGYDDPLDDRWEQAFFNTGFRPGDLVQVTFSYHLVPGAFYFEEGLQHIGCTVVPGGVGNTEIQLDVMRKLKVTGVVGTPSFLMTLAERAQEKHLDPKRDFCLEVAFVIAEMLTPKMRQTLESTWGCTVRQAYGTADVGCLAYECWVAEGMHICDKCIVEILTPENYEPTPPGEVGEVVATVFNRAYPLIRFATGDLSYLLPAPCSCGRTSARLGKILGRADQSVKVKGLFVHPTQIEFIKQNFPEIKSCQLVINHHNYKDEITFYVELKGIEASEGLRQKLEAALKETLRLKVKIAFCQKIAPDAPLIVDKRCW